MVLVTLLIRDVSTGPPCWLPTIIARWFGLLNAPSFDDQIEPGIYPSPEAIRNQSRCRILSHDTRNTQSGADMKFFASIHTNAELLSIEVCVRKIMRLRKTLCRWSA